MLHEESVSLNLRTEMIAIPAHTPDKIPNISPRRNLVMSKLVMIISPIMAMINAKIPPLFIFSFNIK